MSEIAAFFAARLDEQEAAANAATPAPWQAWYAMTDRKVPVKVSDQQAGEPPLILCESRSDAEHIALNDPQFVLDDIAAKRQILAAFVDRDDRGGYVTIGDWTSCSDSCAADVLERVLRLLVAPFSANPDFDPAWKVDA